MGPLEWQVARAGADLSADVYGYAQPAGRSVRRCARPHRARARHRPDGDVGIRRTELGEKDSRNGDRHRRPRGTRLRLYATRVSAVRQWQDLGVEWHRLDG